MRVVVRFGLVREVIESTRIVPYPKPVVGHHGITSLRGQVIPVLSCPFLSSTPRFDIFAAQQLVVLELPGGTRVGLRASNILRVEIPESDWNEVGHTSHLSLHGSPAKLLHASDLEFVRAKGA